jgi:hypothetical protein
MKKFSALKEKEIGPRLNIKYGFNRASKKTIYGWTTTIAFDGFID